MIDNKMKQGQLIINVQDDCTHVFQHTRGVWQ